METNDLDLLKDADFRSILESKGLNIKDLVLEAKLLKKSKEDAPEEEETTTTSTEKKAGKREVEFSLIVNDYPDFAVRKHTARTDTIVAFMPSFNSYYMKTQKGKNDPVTEDLTRDLWAKFITGGMQQIEIKDSWLQSVDPSVVWYDAVMSYLKNDTVIEMIKKKCPPRFYNMLRSNWDNDQDVIIYKKIPHIYREYRDNAKAYNFLSKNYEFVSEIQTTYSLEQARLFMDRYIQSNLPSDCAEWTASHYYSRSVYGRNNRTYGYGYGYDDTTVSMRPNINMDFDRMCQYFLVESVLMGYKHNMRLFFEELNDVYRMQDQLGNSGIKIKYPDNLASYHLVLSQETQDAKVEIDEKNLAKSVENCKKFEGTVGDYIFICPKSKNDILEEAKMQSNCLASYVQKFTDGDCMLYFMRRKDAPKASLVTIEVICGDVVQKYQARNRQCTDEQNEVIAKWAKRFKEQKTTNN